MLKRLETPDPEEFMKRFKVPITKVARISRNLLKKTSIPSVKQQQDLVSLPLGPDFWKAGGVAHLEEIRTGVRELMKYIDPEDQKYVTTNFEDELYEDEVVHRDFAQSAEVPYSPFSGNIHRLETIIRENQHHITIHRIRNGEPITEEELKSLEKMLFNGQLRKAELEKELGKKLDLTEFIISLTGLGEEIVNEAFASFINQHALNSQQIQFLDTIKLFFTKNGKIDPAKFYESPFKHYHSMGIDGVFNKNQTDRIFEIIEKLNRRGTGA
jgi:type I restriction enzyme, R subunit